MGLPVSGSVAMFGAEWWTGRISPLDGFLVAPAGIKLAETFIRHGASQDEQELVFRRER